VNIVRVLSVAPGEVAASVPEREYRRLLVLPRGRPLSEEMRARAQGARRWYAQHGRPFLAMRRVGVSDIGSTTVRLETGAVLTGEAFAASLREEAAHALVVVAASAGPEVAEETVRLWTAGQPDEAYFLDRLAAVVTERLLVRAASAACSELVPRREHLLPHQSPGCGHWDISEQAALMALLGEDRRSAQPGAGNSSEAVAAVAAADSCGPVTLLDSGALRPQHSVLAAFGVTQRLREMPMAAAACRRCDLDPCGFRRVPHARRAPRSQVMP
jgi:hypothetical protein